MRDLRNLNSIRYLYLAAMAALVYSLPGTLSAANDSRIAVELPAMMQQHMLSNRREHLAAISEILAFLEKNLLAETAEHRPGAPCLLCT
jgi:hypothetical protein